MKTLNKINENPGQGADISQDDSQMKMWASFHAVAQDWNADLQFVKEEQHFFRNLISGHFSQFTDQPLEEQTRRLVSALAKLEKQCHALELRVVEHGKLLLKVVENPFLIIDVLLYKHQHEDLENEMGVLMKKHRDLKRRMMKTSEEILRSEKIKHLLGLGENMSSRG